MSEPSSPKPSQGKKKKEKKWERLPLEHPTAAAPGPCWQSGDTDDRGFGWRGGMGGKSVGFASLSRDSASVPTINTTPSAILMRKVNDLTKGDSASEKSSDLQPSSEEDLEEEQDPAGSSEGSSLYRSVTSSFHTAASHQSFRTAVSHRSDSPLAPSSVEPSTNSDDAHSSAPDHTDSLAPDDVSDDALSLFPEAMAPQGPSSVQQIITPGGDAFDSLEWDPDLPSVPSPDHSPEPVAIKPQPLAYTTVGSLINPNVVPQFSAPNRIQREGGNRRQPLLSMLHQSNSYGNTIQPPRGPPPPLNQANSMQYAQHIACSPARAAGASSSASARSGLSTPASNMQSQDEHLATMMRQFTGHGLAARDPQDSSDDLTPRAPKFPSTTVSVREVGPNDSAEEDARSRSNSIPPGKGLENLKMVTLQHLSKFENPMQTLAQSRLKELALSTDGQQPGQEEGQQGQRQGISAAVSGAPTANDGPGQLDRGYRFPQGSTGRSDRSLMHTSQLPSRPLPQTSSTQTRTGVPPPLSAGPPGGRRQSNLAAQSALNYNELYSNGPYGSMYSGYGGAATSNQASSMNPGASMTQAASMNPAAATYNQASPWNQTPYQPTTQPTTQPTFSPAQFDDSDMPPRERARKVVDTMSWTESRKYYPYGFPTDMTQEFTPNTGDYDMADRLAHADEDEAEYKARARREQRENEFYQGQRQTFTTTSSDTRREINEREKFAAQAKTGNPFGVIGPPKKKVIQTAVQPKPIPESSNESNMLPIVDATVSTLMRYMEIGVPGSYREMSRFETRDTRYTDVDEKGNPNTNSFFGEDWGKPKEGANRGGWGQ